MKNHCLNRIVGVYLFIFLIITKAFQAENFKNTLLKDLSSGGDIGIYIVGGILIVGIGLYFFYNYVIKPKEEKTGSAKGTPTSSFHQSHSRHHRQHRILKKTS